MFTTCIYCSSALGRNDALEAFPVGAQVAVDSARGRLWAICPACARWNLAPLEERWEAVEEAERRFRDCRLRVQRENVGLARLPGGTRLLRVGPALPGELAAWRYGDALIARRRRVIPRPPGRVARWLERRPWAGSAAALAAARADRRVVCRLDPERSPTGAALALLRGHLRGAVLSLEGGEPVLDLPAATTPALPARIPGLWAAGLHEPMRLAGAAARDTLARTLVDVNAAGADARAVDAALAGIAGAGGSATFLHRMAARRTTLQLPHRTPRDEAAWDGYWNRRAEREGISGEERAAWRGAAAAAVCGLGPDRATPLALEMALHEEVERRALEGELSVLRAAWREAEAIAALADRLA